MDSFLDIHEISLKKSGEELCGDKVKVFKTDAKTIIVLSDGLGSGVKASILSTLTAEIIVTMVRSDVPLIEVINTVIGTLPICKVRKTAYATFTIIEIENSGQFRVVNFDNPLSFYFKNGVMCELPRQKEKILDKEIIISNGKLERGDFLGAISDGVLYAGLGVQMDFGWGRDNIARFIEGLFIYQPRTAHSIVSGVLAETQALYRGKIGDDATFVGVYVRQRKPLMVFTGPPLDETSDEAIVERLMDFDGHRVICGGTTGNIVARYLHERIETDITSMRVDVPPVGTLIGVDLVTEGIFTMAKCLELLQQSHGEISRIPNDRNGATLLARELLHADSVDFIVGQRMNEFYQNPLLPRSISIRRQLVEELAQFLLSSKKEVRVEFC